MAHKRLTGWSSAKLLLDLDGHFLPTGSTGFADAIGGTKRHYTTPVSRRAARAYPSHRKKRMSAMTSVAPRTGFEPVTRCLEGSCSIQLSYRGVPDLEAIGGIPHAPRPLDDRR